VLMLQQVAVSRTRVRSSPTSWRRLCSAAQTGRASWAISSVRRTPSARVFSR
jgi:hypothetical protein